jgi:hypothetical protein
MDPFGYAMALIAVDAVQRQFEEVPEPNRRRRSSRSRLRGLVNPLVALSSGAWHRVTRTSPRPTPTP